MNPNKRINQILIKIIIYFYICSKGVILFIFQFYIDKKVSKEITLFFEIAFKILRKKIFNELTSIRLQQKNDYLNMYFSGYKYCCLQYKNRYFDIMFLFKAK